MADTELPISPINASKPELTLSAASLNDHPIELDSTPISPQRAKQAASRRGSRDDISPEEQEVRARCGFLLCSCPLTIGPAPRQTAR